MIIPRKTKWVNPSDFCITYEYAIKQEKNHHIVFAKFLEKYLNDTDTPILRVEYRQNEKNKKHLFQVNNNILVEIDMINLRINTTVYNTHKVPLENDLIKFKNKYCI